MSCDDVIERLEAHIAGRLDEAERCAIEAHLRACADCRELRAVLAGVAAEPPADLVTAVLRRTSGSTCGSARERLCDHVDGTLGEVEAALLRAHLDGCEECRALGAALARLAVELPRLAEVPLDERFVEDVLARTSSRRPLAPRWNDRMAEVWQSLIRRPRLAWEGAYVATAVLMLIFATPTSPLAGVPAKMIELARLNPVHEMKEPAARLTADLGQTWEELGVGTVLRSSGQWVAGKSREGADRVVEFSDSALDRLRGLGTLWADDASESGQEDEGAEAERDDPPSSANE